jgi:hypothetical protein
VIKYKYFEKIKKCYRSARIPTLIVVSGTDVKLTGIPGYSFLKTEYIYKGHLLNQVLQPFVLTCIVSLGRKKVIAD